MERRNIIITAIVVVVVAAAVLAVFLTRSPLPSVSGPGVAPGSLKNGGAGATAMPSGPVTRTAVPANVIVPSAGASGTPADVAVPTNVTAANPTNSASARVFSVKIDNNAFTPNQVIVYTGDTVTIKFTAVDKQYDWTLPDFGMSVTIPKGTTKQIQFSPNGTGKFLFYCASCGGPTAGPTGYIVVAPKQ